MTRSPGDADRRPIHLRPSSLALVFVGGTLGTAARQGLSLAIPPVHGVPVAIFGVNVAGALLLGVLLGFLVRRGPDTGRRRSARLLLGTGLMGGFTTYSALAVDSAVLLGSHHAVAGLVYALGTVVIGTAASGVGIALSAAPHRPGPREA